MPDPVDSPNSDASSILYSNHDGQQQTSPSPPDRDPDSMDLSSDNSDSAGSPRIEPIDQNKAAHSNQLEASNISTLSYTPNGQDPRSPPLPSSGYQEEHNVGDPSQRKRKWSNEIGSSRLTTISPHPGHQVNPILGYPIGHIVSDGALYHKRAKLGERSVFLPRNTVSTVPQDRSQLPGEILQHILTFLPPASLGRLLSVNRVFNTILTPMVGDPFQGKEIHGSLKFQIPNSVWIASRKAYCPGMPRPLSCFTELGMWKLLRNRNCQFCGKAGMEPSSLAVSPVRIVWPFGVRSCNECLEERTEKEMDLLFSSLPSILIPALPFAFFTQSFDIISSVTMRNSGPPSGIPIAKYYFKPHIQDIKQKLEEVKSMGQATAEEWIKGLESNGKQKLADAARWEQWESNGGLKVLNARHSAKAREPEIRHPPVVGAFPPSRAQGQTSAVLENGSGHSTPASNFKSAHENSNVSPARPPFPMGNGLPPRPSSPPTRSAFPYPYPNHQAQPRVERSMKDINEAKANRRNEIERRCLEIDPPLTSAVLSHMESFQAAIQIPWALTDSNWEILKPRLLAQRDVAEHREQDRLMQHQLIQVKTEERRQQEAHQKEAKESLDREWEEVQKPIRERLGLYAEEVIRDSWAGGDSLTKDKCAKFAADVLMHVHDRFYADLDQEDRISLATGIPIEHDAPDAPPTRRIILENMKWVFDTTIKPLTEQYQKELFLCNGCENNKSYGFEGVVQHYAAKHTNSLSMGSIVVHWRADWPDIPPFNPNPTMARNLHYGVLNQGPATSSAPGGPFPQGSLYSSATDQAAAAYGATSPDPYGRTYGSQYPTYHTDPYKPSSPSVYGTPYQAPQQLYQPVTQNAFGYQQGPNYPPTNVPYGNFPGPYQPPSQQPMYSPYPGQAYPAQLAISEAMATPTFPASIPYAPQAQTSYQAYPPQPNPLPMNGPPVGFQQIQLDKLAKDAGDLWKATAGVKEMPGSLRVFVILQHVVLKFKDKYTNEPSLGLFTNGLNGHALMRPLRSIHGLACKACANGLSDLSAFHSQPPEGEKKVYTLPALLSHFQTVHIERAKPAVVPQDGIETPRLDWKSDMIALPEPAVLRDLMTAPGMDNPKLELIAKVVKDVFPSTLPKIVPVPISAPPVLPKDEPLSSKLPAHVPLPARPVSPYHSGTRPESQSYHPRSPSPIPPRGLEVVVDGYGRFVDSPTLEISQPVEPPREDEYDPHRPAPLQPTRDSFGRDERLRFQPRPSPLAHETIERRPREGDYARSQVSDDRRTDEVMDSDRQRYIQSDIQPTYVEPLARRANTPDVEIHRGESLVGYELRRTLQHNQNDFTRTISRQELSLAQSGPGSEEGEEPIISNRQEEQTLADTKPGSMTDADRFLSNLVPGSGHEASKITDAEYSPHHPQHPEVLKKGPWSGPTADDERRRYAPPDTARDSRAWRVDTNAIATAENSALGTPTRHAPSNGWSSHRKSPAPASGSYAYEYKPEVAADGLRPPSERPGDYSPEYDPRHLGGSLIHELPRHSADHHYQRPNSRFNRYEAQRHPSYSARSKSPQPGEPASVEQPSYYQERSSQPRQPRQVYAQSPEYGERPSAEEPVAYTRIPSQSYQYVEEPRYVDMPYDRRAPVEYIRVREPQSYYIERPVHREYIRYDGDYSAQPLIEHNGQYYQRAAPRTQLPERQDSLPRQYRY